MTPLFLLLVGCPSTDTTYPGAFDEPSALAVLQPERGGPFDVPVGYVADLFGGRIEILDLSSGRFLTDEPGASFARALELATGRDRVLSGLAAWAPDAETVYVFAADQRFDQLVRVPHVIGTDAGGAPLRYELTWSDPVLVGSGTATLDGLEFRAVPTEDWTVERTARETWAVRGSRSGLLPDEAVTGEPYEGPRGIVSFTVSGDAVPGDRFEIRTEAGTVEYDAGGAPLALGAAPLGDRLALVVHDAVLDHAVLRWFDPVTEAFEDVALPDDARPGRFGFTDEALFVADLGRPAAWELPLDGSTPIEHVLPWPIVDVAPLTGDGERLLYVVPREGTELWIYDLDAGALRDVNPWTPQVDGLSFIDPIRGVEAIPFEHDWTQLDDDGEPLSGRTVAVALASERVVLSQESTGCLVQDELGPRTEVLSSFGGRTDFQTNFDGVPFSATLVQNATNTRHVIVNPCAGIAPSETWSLRFDQAAQAWQVEGNVSGLQQNLALEDVRYVSDGGEVSFVVRSGATPSVDGWLIQFAVLSGELAGNGENDGVAPREVELVLPGDPKAFWNEVDGEVVPWLLIPSAGSDVAARMDPTTGALDVSWW